MRNTANWDSTPSVALEIIDQLSELGTKFIHFSGGEPTLRKDLSDLILKAKEKGMIVALTTNGYGSPKVYRSVLQADIIRISIDGFGEYHDMIRSKRNAYDRAMKVIQFLLENNKKPVITMTISDDTPDTQITSLIEVAKRFGIRLHLNPIGRKHGVKEDNTPDSSNIVTRIRRFQALHKEVIGNLNPYLSVLKVGGLDQYGCRAMDVAISIKADGSVSLPCTGMAKHREKGNLKSIFYGSEAARLRLIQGRHPLCQGCSIRCMATASALLKASGFLSICDTYRKEALH
jgi:MoaA/NifB/PqqE/SkfB family radical SAM enzyme